MANRKQKRQSSQNNNWQKLERDPSIIEDVSTQGEVATEEVTPAVVEKEEPKEDTTAVVEKVEPKKTIPAVVEKVEPKKTAPILTDKMPHREAAPEKNPKVKLNREGTSRKYSAAVPIGGVFVLLAIIGLITVIMFSVQATERLIDNSKEKEKFENMILPVLMFDPIPFQDPKEMGNIALLRSSIWSAIIQNSQKYSFNDGNMVNVPQSDVDVACVKLFGPNVVLEHQYFEDLLSIYSYDQETKVYYVPVDASMLYTPQVEGISKKGDVLSLTVGYLAPDNQWMMSIKGEKQTPTPSKYMIYEMKKVEGDYQLIGIKDPPDGVVPGVPQITQQPATPIQEIQPPSSIPAEPINPEDKTKQQEEKKEQPNQPAEEVTPAVEDDQTV